MVYTKEIQEIIESPKQTAVWKSRLNFTQREEYLSLWVFLFSTFRLPTIGNPPENSLELVVKIIDVRYNKKEAEQILSRSEKLRRYSLLLEYIREYRKESYPLREAIDKAVKRCIEEDIL